MIESPVSDLKLEALGVSRDEMLRRIRTAVEYAVENGSRSRTSASTARAPTRTSFARPTDGGVEAGASEAVVVDTIGVATPEAAAQLVGQVADWPDVPIHFHGHNDFGSRDRERGRGGAGRRGLGARHGQRHGRAGGEREPRRGRARARALYGVETASASTRVRDVSARVREPSPGYELEPWKPLVGENLFRRESGAVASQFHDPPSIEPYSSELVGAERGSCSARRAASTRSGSRPRSWGSSWTRRRAELLEAVKKLGAEARGLVTDDEFRELAAQA